MYYTFTVTIVENNGKTNTTSRRIFSNNPEAVRQTWINDMNRMWDFKAVYVVFSEPSSKRRV